ncbi:hypothetical protein P9W99_19570 [Bacillus cereus]|uniref:Uncharacterized protein n=2 Tax=Bacillus cereus group TaxID=86661 RepID=A0A9W4A798_BACTO|nr:MULTISPECIES: hypothetical protein [Bacillus cereus group]AGE75853.1 hypothetical protein HD73_0268 [Bacillus thuringiensis serovar kurstaki str. HD73]AHZ49108.1 hypothetical protein YBT1520_01675 [Bacillus thuringiensis serovar kurstaki str. YBT-1520]AIE31437.1 hypothetical protein BTK_01525 [Bacillus thuringiensis serovar kurstaki str. HD-1]AJA17578.1 hypothetical protein BT4G5_01115 [Bacillus thuringiensis serovar galleriae]AJK42415.1 hypothetical protein BG08_5780 [Bacillus thuringiensi
MEIKVNEQAQRFYLAFDEWVPAVGHEIKVGKYRFCAIPLSKSINISEVTSGVHAMSIPIDFRIWMATSTKEDTMRFLEKAGEGLKRILKRQSNLDELLKKNKKIAFDRLGEMPPIEDVDTDWITAEISDVTH